MTRSSAFVLLLVLLPASWAQAPGPVALPRYAGFDERYGVAAGTEPEALIGKPSIIAMSAEKYRDSATGEWRLVGFGEAQAVYDADFDQVLKVLDDPAGAISYSPRLLDSRIEEKEGARVVVYQEVGISFLGFKLGYRFLAEQVRDDLGPREVGYRIRLLESLDGKFFDAYTSWYAKELELGGRRLVYLRYYTRPGLRKPVLGMDLIIKSFTPGEMKSTMDRVANEARRRSAQK